MDKEFKDSENPLRIVFVCAMWLTGFDVKSLANLSGQTIKGSYADADNRKEPIVFTKGKVMV